MGALQRLEEKEEYDEDTSENEINQQEENNLLKNISVECFEDPIKMLEWFSKIEENEDLFTEVKQLI